jgi:hypothetical protein
VIDQDIATARALYARMATMVAPSKDGATGRRVVPASRPPGRIDVISAMASLEAYVRWWCGEAEHLLGGR